MHEVVGQRRRRPSAAALAATGAQLTWGHRKVFGRLDEMAGELRADPSQAAARQGRDALPPRRRGDAGAARPAHDRGLARARWTSCPASAQGMRNVALDEQRHIGFGVKLLADLYAETRRARAEAIAEVLREVAALDGGASRMPPGWDLAYTERFGFTLEDLGEEGARSLEQQAARDRPDRRDDAHPDATGPPAARARAPAACG